VTLFWPILDPRTPSPMVKLARTFKRIGVEQPFSAFYTPFEDKNFGDIFYISHEGNLS